MGDGKGLQTSKMAVPNSSDKFIDRLSKAVGLGAAIAFVLSVVYDWAYLDALGLSFSAVPTSISDHVRTGLLWLPVVGASISMGIVYGMLSKSGESDKTAAVIAVGKRFRMSPEMALRVLAVLGLAFFALLGGSAVRLYLILALGLIAFGDVFLSHPRVVEAIPNGLSRFLIWALPAAVILVGSFGAMKAEGDRRLDRPKATFKDETKPSATRTLRPIRHFERVVLAIDDQGRLVILRTDDLVSIEDLPRPYYFEGAMCSLFQIGCGRVP